LVQQEVADEPRFGHCSALRWVGLVLRVGAVRVILGAGCSIARAAPAHSDGFAGSVPLALATSSASLGLRPANRSRRASPLRRVATARRAWNDVQTYAASRDPMRSAPQSAALARDRDRPGARWIRRARASGLSKLGWASVRRSEERRAGKGGRY